jgi:hypothetical protein
LCIPLLLLHFAVFFSFSALLAVLTRSTVVCAFGSLLFWLVACGVNFGRHAALVLPGFGGPAPGGGRLLETAYWVLPKPLDFHLILTDALEAQNLFAELINPAALAGRGAWFPDASVFASLAFAALVLAVAAREFVTTDY